MTSAQSRALRQVLEREARLKEELDKHRDILLAVLAHHGGEVRIPTGTVQTATRDAITAYFDKDDLVVVTRSRWNRDHGDDARKEGFVKRIFAGLFSDN